MFLCVRKVIHILCNFNMSLNTIAGLLFWVLFLFAELGLVSCAHVIHSRKIRLFIYLATVGNLAYKCKGLWKLVL